MNDIEKEKNNRDSIFEKKTKKLVLNLKKDKLLESLPTTKIRDNKLCKIKTEWQLKFFNINGIEIVEISFQKQGENRKYLDNCNRWIEHNENTKYDKYITEIYYSYLD